MHIREGWLSFLNSTKYIMNDKVEDERVFREDLTYRSSHAGSFLGYH